MSTLTANTVVSHAKDASTSTERTLISASTSTYGSTKCSRSSTPERHRHDEGMKCPFTGQDEHAYCPPQKGDVRSPCPALNALANHGYLPRNGQGIRPMQLIRALKAGYNLTTTLATILTIGAILVLRQFCSISLSDLSRHNLIEHDASVIHKDAKRGSEYASTRIAPSLVRRFFSQVGHDRLHSNRITLEDVAQVRVTREEETHVLDKLHEEVARGELTIAMGVIGGKQAYEDGADVGSFRQWLVEERFPDGWKPDHKQGLIDTFFATRRVQKRMNVLRAAINSKKAAVEKKSASKADGSVKTA